MANCDDTNAHERRMKLWRQLKCIVDSLDEQKACKLNDSTSKPPCFKEAKPSPAEKSPKCFDIPTCFISPRKIQSINLRNSTVYRCECIRRNGLQDRCMMSDCMGRPECKTKLYPICEPGQAALRKIQFYNKLLDDRNNNKNNKNNNSHDNNNTNSHINNKSKKNHNKTSKIYGDNYRNIDDKTHESFINKLYCDYSPDGCDPNMSSMYPYASPSIPRYKYYQRPERDETRCQSRLSCKQNESFNGQTSTNGNYQNLHRPPSFHGGSRRAPQYLPQRTFYKPEYRPYKCAEYLNEAMPVIPNQQYNYPPPNFRYDVPMANYQKSQQQMYYG